MLDINLKSEKMIAKESNSKVIEINMIFADIIIDMFMLLSISNRFLILSSKGILNMNSKEISYKKMIAMRISIEYIFLYIEIIIITAYLNVRR